MGFHAFLGGFALSTAALNWYLQKERVAIAVSSLNVPQETLEMTARVFLLVGCIHFVVIVRVLYQSFRARRLVLHAPKVVIRVRNADGLVNRLFTAYDAVSIAWGKLFSPTGFFGFSNPHFETLFLFREGWEILLQTYQAYKLSQSVPRKWINQLAVAVIVLNCISSPLVHLLFRRHEGRRRVINLIQDAVLDFCCSIVIPMSILMPYARVYNTTKNNFPAELLMDDSWYVNAIAETRQVLVTSFPDFVATIVPQLSLLGYLMTFKNLLRRRPTGIHHDLRSQPSRQNISAETKPQLLSPPPLGPMFSSNKNISITNIPKMHRKYDKLHKVVSIVLHVLFILWGCGVLGLHLEAYADANLYIPGCQLHISAWHSSRYPCSVMLLNCHVAQIDGSESELTLIFDQLERSTLQVLVFSHCPQLTMTPVITEFSQLVGIEFFNSTLVEWPEQAAIREATQPRIGYMYFILTNWTSFPAGLLHDQLPKRFTHWFVVANNLTELPDAIGAWSSHEWITIIFERVPFLATVPESFCSLRADALWIAGSGLTSLPSECATHDRLVELSVTGSAMRSLPDQIGPNVQFLYAENTDIAELPDWFDSWYQSAPAKVVAFHGSEVCDSTGLHEGLWDVACRDEQPIAQVAYPIDMMLGLRPFDGPQRHIA